MLVGPALSEFVLLLGLAKAVHLLVLVFVFASSTIIPRYAGM
jgi:hypothetical protein